MPTMIKAIFFAAALACMGPIQAAKAADSQDGIAVVEHLHANLLQIMRDADTLGYAGRVSHISPVLAETFDFTTIARIVTGAHWQSLGPEQQVDFQGIFARLSAATYASNFDGFSGESFETLNAEERRGNLLVKSNIKTGDGELISLDYVLREGDNGWRIVNVIAQGVSDLSLKRADYTAVIRSEGYDSLVAKLNGKISSYDADGR